MKRKVRSIKVKLRKPRSGIPLRGIPIATDIVKVWKEYDENCIRFAKKELARPRCIKCNSRQVYVLKDGTRVCRKCGHREKPKKEKILNV